MDNVNQEQRIDTSDYSPLLTDVFKVISSDEKVGDIVDEVAALYCSTGCLIRNRVFNKRTLHILHQDTTFIPDTYIHETISHDKKLVRRYIKQSNHCNNKVNTVK